MTRLLFDLDNGDVHVGPATFRPGISPDDVTATGISWLRVLDMHNGWVHRSTTLQALADASGYASGIFEHDRLRMMRLFLAGDSPAPPPLERQFDAHADFLRRVLGRPDEQLVQGNFYRYPWGTVSAMRDPRAGDAYIVIDWQANMAAPL